MRPLVTARRPHLLVAFAVAFVVWPADGRGQEVEPVVIDYARQMRRVVEEDSLTYYLDGNVRAHRGIVQMRSQKAIIYRESQIADFERDVHFWDDTTEIYADHLVYDELRNVALADGRVQLIDRDTKSQVSADSVRYEIDGGLITAWPRPHGVLFSRDTTAQRDPFDIWADVMRFTSDSTRTEVVAIRQVLIERHDLTAVSDSLRYDETSGLVELRLDPQVETLETFLTADRIDVNLDDNAIESLVAIDRARVVNKADSIPVSVPPAFNNVSQTSFLEGDSIYVALDDQVLDWVVAQGTARSLNYTRESPPGELEIWSINYLLGERLRLEFAGDTLRQVVASGGHRGLYRSREVRIGGPERRPSEPIPLDISDASRAAVVEPRRRQRVDS